MPFITPFVPAYASGEYADEWKAGGVSRPDKVDYTHEREWRVPTDLRFDHRDIAFVIVRNNADGERVASYTGGLGGKILLIDNYEWITELWPPY